MSKNDLYKTIKEVVAETLNVDEEEISIETSLLDLGCDSLDIVELVIALENKLGISIKDEDISNLNTVGDFIEYAENLVA